MASAAADARRSAGPARRTVTRDRELSRRRADTLRAALAAALLVGVTVWAWHGLWVDAPVTRLVLVALLGAIPALTIVVERGVGGRLALLAVWVVAAVMVVGLATDVSIRSLLRLRHSAWRTVADLVDQGFTAAATVTIPLSGEGIRSTTALLAIVIATTVSALVALTFAARRPVPAVIGALIAIAYRWTLVPPGRPRLEGLVVVAVALVVIALVHNPRRVGAHPARTLAAGVAVLGVAAVGSLAVWGSGAWWDWQNWSWGDDIPGTTILSTAQSYGPLRYGTREVEVARVRTQRVASLRAVSLARFDGISFTEDLRHLSDLPLTDGGATVAANFGSPTAGAREVKTDVTLSGTRTRWLFTSGTIRGVSGLGGRDAELFRDSSVRVEPEMPKGARYAFTSVFVNPGPDALLAVRYADPAAVDPAMLTIEPGRGAMPVTVPVFGSGQPAPPPEAFGPYAEVARRSRRLAEGATSPYEVVNHVERYLRSTRFTYDRNVARPTNGRPDLAVFLLEDPRGYCQQFAGAMALMLRMNGIPARVAVGFNVSTDRYDARTGTYRVVDQDAHSWVEVEFPGYGWLPFDPTPGVADTSPNSASVVSEDYAPPAQLADPATDPVTTTEDPAPVTPVEPRPDPAPSPAPQVAADGGAGWSLALGLVGLLLALATSPLVAKAVRRRLRRRGDERARVLGAVREIESFMTDLGRPPDPASTGRERSAVARHDLGIDAERIYRLAGAARFGTSPPSARAAGDAWADVRAARRSVPFRARMAADLRTRSLRRPRA